ncbi:MAG TPA: hypothetical protein VFV94_12805 [Polyangiaceae bacterium]|nr:hypothetical protein [Polyangiaceae bacterium]
MRGVFWGAVGLATALACAGKSTSGPYTGGESHFLHRCASTCDGDLECVSGVCTKPCIVGESDCSGLSEGAVCTNESVEPGAVAICDVACKSDGDCSVLGGEHGCDLGFCRAPAPPPSSGGTGAGPTLGGAGGAGGSASTAAGAGGSASTAAGTGGAGGTLGATAGSSGVVDPSCKTTLIASPEQNYEFASAYRIPPVLVKPESDILFDWSGVTTDFRGRPLDLDTVDMVEIALWQMTLEEFEQALNDDTLANPIVIGHILVSDGVRSASVFDLTVPAGALDEKTIVNYLNASYYPPANHLYSVMVAHGEDYGQGTYMLGTFQLDPDSTNTTVDITSTSTVIDFSAHIASRPATYVPPGVGAMTIDWTDMEVTAAGNQFLPSSITQVRIASYDQSPELLEGEYFGRLDEIAVEMFEGTVDTGTTFPLEQATTNTGKPFAGIDATHTWLLALSCGACQNPAPWYLTVLKPCTAPR